MFEFLQAIADFFTTGIYTFFEEAAKYFITTLLIWFIKGQIWALSFAWEIAESVLTSLDVMAKVTQGFSMLPADVSAGIAFFRVPDAVNLLITAGMTRFVLSMVPFL